MSIFMGGWIELLEKKAERIIYPFYFFLYMSNIKSRSKFEPDVRGWKEKFFDFVKEGIDNIKIGFVGILIVTIIIGLFYLWIFIGKLISYWAIVIPIGILLSVGIAYLLGKFYKKFFK